MLRDAADELRYLLDRGYRKDYALDFVCDHHKLRGAERATLARSVFSFKEASSVKRKMLSLDDADGREVCVDGYNVLITCEAACAGRALVCDDGVVRDTEGVFGKYKVTPSTWETLEGICRILEKTSFLFLFDAQVSRSGKIVEYLTSRGHEAMTERHVDSAIIKSGLIAATSDSVILEKVSHFIDVPRQMLLEM
jgi:hypothetical protein